ncbi:MAG: hypothetical protein WAQ98_13395 [Blastocatellia bacterium]
MSEKKLTYTELERLVWIDQEIINNKYPNTNKIAQHLSITTKTAQRAIDFMCDRLKYPLEYCPKNRGWYYTKEPKHKLALIHLSEGDLVAIIVICLWNLSLSFLELSRRRWGVNRYSFRGLC